MALYELYSYEVHFTSHGSALLPLDNVPVCNCGEVAQLLTVRREDSVNKGNNLVHAR